MRDTLEVINRMQADGVIGKYAIGGAVGATFYLSPSATLDVDVFVTLPETSGGLLTLSPIYEYLTARGCTIEHEHVIIGKWPVQFLPASNALEEDALIHAIEVDLEGVPTRVMSAEHLVAIALNTGRTKDFARIVQFLEQNVIDSNRLSELISRFGLQPKWNAFRLKYLGDAHE